MNSVARKNIIPEKVNVPFSPSKILMVLTPSFVSDPCWYICVSGYIVPIKKLHEIAE